MLQFSLCAKMISMNGIGAIINKIIDLHFARSHTRSNPWQKSVKKSPRLAADLPKSCQQFATSLCILPGVTPLALLLANFPGASAPDIFPWQNAGFLVVL